MIAMETREKGEAVGQVIAGEVAQLGPKVDAQLAVGDHVLALLPMDYDNSGLAEYCTAPYWWYVGMWQITNL